MRTMTILAAALLALAPATAAAQEACSQAQLEGDWRLSSAAGNSCDLSVQPNGRYSGPCTGPDFRRGNEVRGALKVKPNCSVNGTIRGAGRNGTFGPLPVGPATMFLGGLVAGVTNTGDGNKRHIFIMIKFR